VRVSLMTPQGLLSKLAQAQRVGYRVYVHDATRLLAVIDSGADVLLAELPRRVMCAWNVSPTARGA